MNFDLSTATLEQTGKRITGKRLNKYLMENYKRIAADFQSKIRWHSRFKLPLGWCGELLLKLHRWAKGKQYQTNYFEARIETKLRPMNS